MIDKITIRERGATPRGFKRAYNASSAAAWYDTGQYFHANMRDERFTKQHGKKAGYKLRRGEEPGIKGSAFWRSYTGQKLKKWRHTNPLQWSGDVRRRVKMANISSVAKGARVAYPGANKLNFRNPASNINMAEEFRRLLPDEIVRLAMEYDKTLDTKLNQDNTTSITQV